MKKILFLSPYPKDCAPSQRLKYEQYYGALKSQGFEITTSSFVSERLWKILYQDGNFLLKAFYVSIGYIQRLYDLYRIPKYDIVYVHLWVTPAGPPIFERLVRWRSKRLVYDIDDMVFLGHSSAANRLFQFLKGKAKMIQLMKLSDHVITCTPTLDEFVRKFNLNTTDISSTINTEIYQPRVSSKNFDKGIVLGWSGSHSTSKYLHILDKVIQRLSKEYDVKLKVIGDSSFHIDGVDVHAMDWSEENEVQELAEIDIGLYPLPNEEWVYGKSGLKALQYMALGVPTIATAIGANFRIIEDGESGFLLDTETVDKWYDSIKMLIEDQELYQKFSKNGRKVVEKKYSVKACTSLYLDALDFDVDMAVVIPNLDRGGAEKNVIRFVEWEALRKRVEIILLDSKVEYEIPEGVRVKVLTKGNQSIGLLKLLWLFYASFKYRSYVNFTQPKESVSFLNRPNFINVLATHQLKSVTTVINERSYPAKAYSKFGLDNLITRNLLNWLYPKSDYLVCNSKLTAKYFSQKYKQAADAPEIMVWYNPTPKSKQEIVKTGLSSRSAINILTVGRLDDNKNQESQIRAIYALNDKRITLHVVGKGINEKRLVELTKSLKLENQVIFYGQRNNTDFFYQNADIFMLTSRFEGFPNVLLEAFSHGVPIITTDCESGPREICEVDYNEKILGPFYAESGVLIPLGDIGSLKASIQKLIVDNDYYQRLSINGYKRLKQLQASKHYEIPDFT